jgi:hypothetical protein
VKVHIARAYVTAKALDRVNDALVEYAPPFVEFVDAERDADLVVMHVAGRWRRISHDVRRIRRNGQRHAIIQYSQRDTQRQDVYDWLAIWKRARVVWSYLPLNDYIKERGNHKPMHQLYLAPMGVDTTAFYPRGGEREYTICTSGRLYMTESVREAVVAARRVGGRVAHLGPEMNKRGVDCYSGLTDDEVAQLYSRCQWVAGLRRREGFELPAAEGLLCGARPIVFNRRHYIMWYGEWAEYIPERDRADVIDDLERLFRQGPRPVTEQERIQAALRFHWPNLVHEFWQRATR